MSEIFISSTAQQTKKIAKELAKTILKSPQRKRALVLALKGELGTGKTSFVQGFAKGLGIKENVLSPTFLIVKGYKLKTINHKLFYHIDAYRLGRAKELLWLGWKEIIKDPKNIIAIEWAGKVKSIIPKDALWLSFYHRGEDARIIRFG